jgi:hypothetical protein
MAACSEATEQFRFVGLTIYGWLQESDILAASNGQLKQRDKDGGLRQKEKQTRMKPVTVE